MQVQCHIFNHFYKGKVLLCLPVYFSGGQRPFEMGSAVKSKNMLQGEQILSFKCTVQILCIGTDRSQQTVQTKIRLLLKKQSDQGLRCLPFQQHLLDALMQCYIKLFFF